MSSIQPPSSYNPTDRLKIWLAGVQFGQLQLPRRLNFSNRFIITEDALNNFFNIDIPGSGGTLPTDVVYTDVANTWITAQNLPAGSKVSSDNITTNTAVQALTHKDMTDSTNTFPTSLVNVTGSQTLTNKNMTDSSNSFPSSLVTLTASQALTNKDLTGAGNTFPTSFIKNNQNNSFGAFYEDVSEIAKPANPASGTRRLYVDSTTHALSSLDSGGTSHNLEASGSGPTFTKGKATFSPNGSTYTFNIAHGLGVTPTYVNVTPASAGAIQGQFDNSGSTDHESAAYWVTTDSTNITVNFPSAVSAPPSGTSTLVYWWIAFA